MKKSFFLLQLLAFLMVGLGAFAQTVTGVVMSEDGPLPGATIIIKGTTQGTTSDFDGNFSINADADAVLEVSFVGFISQDIAVNNQKNLTVTLASDNALDEVVVTGYGTQTRGSLSGSVASVDVADAIKTPVVNAAETLQGRVTGVQVVTSGNPGQAPKINIRGFGTSNNTDPLYIIDGVQTDDPLVLNNINPADIEQMNVLKDGAAAIYGARASNGVVIITTKGGSYNMDGAQVSFDFYTGTSQISNSPKLLNAEQHAQMIWDSYTNDGLTPSHPQYGSGANPVVPSSIIGYTRVASYNPIQFAPVGQFSAPVTPGGTDWIDAITRSAPVTNASFSIANGSESARYYFGLGYLDRQGILNYTGFKRGNLKFNSEAKIKDRIKVGQHINLSYSNTMPGVDESIEGALRITPLLPVKDSDGNYTGVAGPGLSNTRNPAAQLYRSRNDYFKRFNLIGDIYVSYDIMDGLTAKTTIAGALNTFDSRQFTSLDPEHGEPISTQTLNEQNQTKYNWNWASTLNYNADFGAHTVNALIGVEAVKESDKGLGVTRQGYLFEDPTFYLLSNGSGAPNVSYAYDGYSTLFSVFGTVNYSYEDKYFFTATVRNDESSRFADYKSDIFPSFSAAWDISAEDFFPSGAMVNYLKVKASWGQLGNQTLPADNPTINISKLSESIADYSFNDGAISQGAYLDQVGNPNLKWETSETTNFGLDLGLLDSKLSIAAEYFRIKTKDLITRDFSLISSTAIDAGAPLVNLGDIQNTGFDFSMGYSDATTNGLTYDISFNLSHYKNEVTALINDAPVFGRGDLRNGAMTRTIVGEELSHFYGREVIGLDSNGRMMFAPDEDGDGDDRKIIGSPHPDFTYGININLGYQGFDVAAFFTGSQGNDVYNYSKVFTDFGYFFLGNRNARVLNAWTPSNTNTNIPALSASYPLEESSPNSYFVEDGSFFRLKNLQLGYTLPESIAGNIGADSVRIYLQGTNLFTLTQYSGYDPEVVSYDDPNIQGDGNLTLGVDARVYPFSKTLTIGTNIKF